MYAIVGGYIATYPMGGMTWHYLQYLLGLKKLGWNVLYLEDTGQWTYDLDEQTFTENPKKNIDYLSNLMSRFGLESNWSFRHINGDYYGKIKKLYCKLFVKQIFF